VGWERPQIFSRYRCISADGCWISLKFGVEFDHVTADTLQAVKVNGQRSRSHGKHPPIAWGERVGEYKGLLCKCWMCRQVGRGCKLRCRSCWAICLYSLPRQLRVYKHYVIVTYIDRRSGSVLDLFCCKDYKISLPYDNNMLVGSSYRATNQASCNNFSASSASVCEPLSKR